MIRLWFEASVTPDVNHSHPRACEGGRDEETPMAACRIFFGTEDHGPPTLPKRDESRDCFHEVGSQRTTCVVDAAVRSIEFAAVRTTTELSAHEHVLDAVITQASSQLGLIKVRGPLRVRLRSHVDELLDRVRAQERHELLSRVP